MHLISSSITASIKYRPQIHSHHRMDFQLSHQSMLIAIKIARLIKYQHLIKFTQVALTRRIEVERCDRVTTIISLILIKEIHVIRVFYIVQCQVHKRK